MDRQYRTPSDLGKPGRPTRRRFAPNGSQQLREALLLGGERRPVDAELDHGGVRLTEQEPEPPAQFKDAAIEAALAEIRRRGGYGAVGCSRPGRGFKRIKDEVPGALAEILGTVQQGRHEGKGAA